MSKKTTSVFFLSKVGSGDQIRAYSTSQTDPPGIGAKAARLGQRGREREKGNHHQKSQLPKRGMTQHTFREDTSQKTNLSSPEWQLNLI